MPSKSQKRLWINFVSHVTAEMLENLNQQGDIWGINWQFSCCCSGLYLYRQLKYAALIRGKHTAELGEINHEKEKLKIIKLTAIPDNEMRHKIPSGFLQKC